MDELLKRYMVESDRRFEEISETLKSIDVKLDDLGEFKIRAIASSRLVSLIVSAVCGIITMFVTTLLSYKSLKH